MEDKQNNVKTVCDTVAYGAWLLFLYKLIRRIF